MIFDIIYNITIYPIEFVIETLFYLFTNIFKYSYPASLFLLSLSVTLLSLPLYMIAEKWKKEEEKIQAKMKPDIEHIKKNFKGDERFLLIQACYRIYKYKTIYAFRGTLGLLIQIPFFLAAYNFIHNLDGLNGVAFLLIKDLSKPDALINIGNISINVLPFIMTLFSLLSGLVYAKKGHFKENLPVYVIPLIFLILLYTSPSGLLFYWTLNCLFSLIKNLILKHKLEIKNILSDKQLLLKIYSRSIIIIACILFLITILGNVERKGYLKDFVYIENTKYTYNMKIGYNSSIFKNSDIYGVIVSKNKLDSRIIDITFNEIGSPFGKVTLNNKIENIENLEIHYKLFVKNHIFIIFIILSFIYILIKSYKKIQVYTKYIFNIVNNKLPSKSQCKKITNFYNIFIIIVSCLLFLLAIFGNIERKGYLKDFVYIENTKYTYNMKVGYNSSIFRNSDIYGVTVSKNKLDSRIIDMSFNDTGSPFGKITLNNKIENIGNIEIRYKLFVKNYIFIIFILLFIIYFLLNSKNKKSFNLKNIIHKYKISNFKLDIEGKKRSQLLIISCLIITILSGLFIPSSLISSSPTEFKNAYSVILNTLSGSIGLFLFYPIFIYILFSDKIKNILTILVFILLPLILINIFIMSGNYGTITSNFTFDSANKLLHSNEEIYINIIILLTTIIISLIIIFKLNKTILVNLLYILLVVIILNSTINVIKINKETKIYKNYLANSSIENFSLSKKGNNIFIIILDTAVSAHWNSAFERFPEYKEKFDGFIFYPNTASFSVPTFASFPTLYGGYDYDPYRLSIEETNNLTNWSRESILMLPLALSKYDYRSVLLNPAYNNIFKAPFNEYSNINNINYKNDLYETITNNMLINNGISKKNITDRNKYKSIKFSIFKILPIWARHFFYQDANWFTITSSNNINLNTSIEEYYKLFEITNMINITESGNHYNFVHNYVTHTPYSFNSNYMPTEYQEKADINDSKIYGSSNAAIVFYSNMASINGILNLLNYLKNNDLYDNTKIIIASDHGAMIGKSMYSYEVFISLFNSVLIYKDFNSRGTLQIDTNFMTSADVAYLATKHIPNIVNPFNNKVITNDYKTNGINMIYLLGNNEFGTWRHDYRYQFTNSYNFDTFYHVKNNVLDTNNWQRFKFDYKTKKIEKTDLY